MENIFRHTGLVGSRKPFYVAQFRNAPTVFACARSCGRREPTAELLQIITVERAASRIPWGPIRDPWVLPDSPGAGFSDFC